MKINKQIKTRHQENNSAQDKERQLNHQEEDQTATTHSLEVSKALTPVVPVPSSSSSKFWMYERCFRIVKSAKTEEYECPPHKDILNQA